jgi:DNA-binding transcriptional ArsR family regulator
MNDELTPLWKALADPTRRKLLDLLRDEPHTTGDLSDYFPTLSRYAVMKHLGILVEAGLVLVRRRGRERWNYLNAVPLQQMYERWLKPYEGEWASSLIQLKVLAEQGDYTMTAPAQLQSKVHHIEQEILVEADVEKVYACMLDVNGWWVHRLAQKPDMLRLEAQVGGRFWEMLDEETQDGALWGIVTSIRKNDHIVINGSIGMRGVVMGVVTICTNEAENGTQVTLSHQIMGDVSEETVAGYNGGWQMALESLKQFADEGMRIEISV